MIKLNIHQAKTHLSKYLKYLSRGEKIILCKRNVPIAEIRPLEAAAKTRRRIGLAKGEFKITSDFFKPLPPDIINQFYNDDK